MMMSDRLFFFIFEITSTKLLYNKRILK